MHRRRAAPVGVGASSGRLGLGTTDSALSFTRQQSRQAACLISGEFMQNRFLWSMRSVLALGLVVLLASPPARATPASYDLSFVTTDQSLWDTGTANVFNKTEFLGVAWQDKGAQLNAISGDTNTQVPNPARVAYDAAYGLCRLVASASACINGQSGQLPVAALGNRPSVRSCSWWDVGCQFARGGDVIAQAGYDVAYGACTLVHSGSVCRNGQAARLPVAALGAAPAPFSTVDTRTGFAVGGNSDGRVGLNVGIHADSGSVNATVSYRAALDIPDTTGLSKATRSTSTPAASWPAPTAFRPPSRR